MVTEIAARVASSEIIRGETSDASAGRRLYVTSTSDRRLSEIMVVA